MAMCEPGCEIHYGCRLKLKGIQLSPSLKPGPANKQGYRPIQGDQWGKADAKDERGLPVLHSDGTRYTLREYSEKRSKIESAWAAADATRISTGA